MADTATIEAPNTAATALSDVLIPEALIYEMVNGKPIYYRGWQSVLRGETTIEQIMASSLLQSFLVNEVAFQLNLSLRKKYMIVTNEAGLTFNKGDWRAADIALLPLDVMKTVKLDNHYIKQKPEIVIEIDTKADASALPTYYLDKTKHLLKNGIPKVIWIYTETQQIMVAEIGKKWEIFDWSENVEVTKDCVFCVEDLLEGFDY
jgi:Putative restriction endonuclease